MSRTSATSVTATRWLLALNGAAWVYIGALGLLQLAKDPAGHASAIWIVYLLAFANAGVMLWLARDLGQHKPRIYYFALAVVAVNTVLSVTDQVGLADLIILCLNIVLLLLLLATRSSYRRVG